MLNKQRCSLLFILVVSFVILGLMMKRVAGYSRVIPQQNSVFTIRRLNAVRSCGSRKLSIASEAGPPISPGSHDGLKSAVTSSVHLAKHLWAQVIQPGDTCIDATAGNGHDTLELVKLVFPVSCAAEQRRRGTVYFFDIQSSAIRQTSQRIQEYQREGTTEMNLYRNATTYLAPPTPTAAGATVDELVQQLGAKARVGAEEARWRRERQVELYVNARPMHCSHDLFPEDIKKNSVRCIVYNLGYLPMKSGVGDKSITTNAATTIESLKKALDLLCTGGLCTIICYLGHGDIGTDEQAKVEQFLLQQDPRMFRINKNQNILFKEAPVLYSIYKFKVKRPPYLKTADPQSVFIEKIKKIH